MITSTLRVLKLFSVEVSGSVARFKPCWRTPSPKPFERPMLRRPPRLRRRLPRPLPRRRQRWEGLELEGWKGLSRWIWRWVGDCYGVLDFRLREDEGFLEEKP